MHRDPEKLLNSSSVSLPVLSLQEEQKPKLSLTTMSLSALSSALSLSSRSSNSSSRKNSNRSTDAASSSSFRGEICVSSCDGSIADSSLSLSEKFESSRNHEARLPSLLLGNRDSDASDDTLFLSMSSTSSVSFDELPTDKGIGLDLPTPEQSEGLPLRQVESPGRQKNYHVVVLENVHVLENVQYVSSLPAVSTSSFYDLSTLDEPITKEVAREVFLRRVVVPSPVDDIRRPSYEVKTCHQDENDDILPLEDVETGNAPQMKACASTQVASRQVQVRFPWWRRFLGEGSRLEVFFMAVIGFSSSALVVLLIVVLR